MTIQELSKQLGCSEEWIKSHMAAPRVTHHVSWKTFPGTDFYRLCALMVEIGEGFKEPFYHKGDIIVQMSDDFAFVFDHTGKRK